MAENWDGFIEYLEMNYDVQETSSGRQLKVNGQCPFCGDDRDDLRLYVNPETGLGNCFHCGEPFGPYKFIMASEGCSYRQAVSIAGGSPDGWERTDHSQPQEVDQMAWPVHESIFSHTQARQYANDRGLTDDLMRHFGLYYSDCPIKLGDKVFHAEDRIIIPIHDIRGQPVSWVGRTIVNAKPKYLFPPSFPASELLFNAWAIHACSPYVIVCEGVFDAFGWWMNGAKNVVATFGKKISKQQVKILKLISPQIVLIAWDTDAMWENFTFAEEYRDSFDIRIVDLRGRDSDESTKEELAAALQNAKRYRWEDKILAALS